MVKPLINSGNKANIITPAFVAKLGLSIQLIGIGAQKTDRSALKMYGMVIAGFSIWDKMGKIRFFEQSFLLADISMEVVLGIILLVLNNVDIKFNTESFTWRSYSEAEILPTTRWVKPIDKYKFAKAALDKNSKTFVVQVTVLKALEPAIHPSYDSLLAAL